MSRQNGSTLIVLSPKAQVQTYIILGNQDSRENIQSEVEDGNVKFNGIVTH